MTIREETTKRKETGTKERKRQKTNPDRKTYLGSRRVAGIEDSLPWQRRVHVGKTTAALVLKRQRSRQKRKKNHEDQRRRIKEINERRKEEAKIHTDLDEAGVDAPASEGRRTILGLKKKR